MALPFCRLTSVRVAGFVLASLVLAAVPARAQDPTAMSDASAPVPPEQKALDAALRMARATDRMVALDKIRKDYPASPLLNMVDTQLLAAVLQTPDSSDAASEIIDRLIARIPSSASPDLRFKETVAPVSQLISRKVLMDRAEKLLSDAAAALGPTSEYRARSQYELGRLAAARGDTLRAESQYKAAAIGKYPAAVSALVAFYIDRGEREKAESFLHDVVKTTPVNMAALSSLVNLYKSEPARAEALLKDAVGRDPLLPGALLSLAKIEKDKGDEKSALGHYMQAGSMLFLRGPDADAMKELYARAHGGSTAGLEDDINKIFATLPKPPRPAAYIPTARRTDRLVVFEMFTGSACPPCVAADLAMDEAIAKYPENGIIALAYHQHIPGPDPMTTTEGNNRRNFYSVNGVPTAQVDGVMVSAPDGGTFGGGGRDRAPVVAEKYNGLIEAALETAATAALGVKATMAGDKISVTADVTKLPANAGDLRLHIVLAERELLFGGENGIRLHPMVVRGIAGSNGTGLALTGAGATQHTFDLAAIRADIERNLAAEIGRRRGSGGSGGFAAEDHAMTKIDPAHLVVVAFVQAANKSILGAARVDVK